MAQSYSRVRTGAMLFVATAALAVPAAAEGAATLTVYPKNPDVRQTYTIHASGLTPSGRGYYLKSASDDGTTCPAPSKSIRAVVSDGQAQADGQMHWVVRPDPQSEAQEDSLRCSKPFTITLRQAVADNPADDPVVATVQQSLTPSTGNKRLTTFAGGSDFSLFTGSGALFPPPARFAVDQPIIFEFVGLKANRTYGVRVRVTGKKKSSPKKCEILSELSEKTDETGRLYDSWVPKPRKWCKGRTYKWDLLQWNGKEGDPYISYFGKKKVLKSRTFKIAQ